MKLTDYILDGELGVEGYFSCFVKGVPWGTKGEQIVGDN